MLMPFLLALSGQQLEPITMLSDAAPRDDCVAIEPGIRMAVSDLRDQSGLLKLELYPANENDFLAGDHALLRARKVFRRVVTTIPAYARDVTLCVNVPQPGRYAVVVIHKRSRDKSFSIDNDGVSLPGSDHIGSRRPPFEQAIVTVSSGIRTVTSPMQYRRGLAGFQRVSQ